TRSAFARFAVPAHRHVVGLLALDLMNRVEHDHAFDDFSLVVDERAVLAFAAPHTKRALAPLRALRELGLTGGIRVDRSAARRRCRRWEDSLLHDQPISVMMASKSAGIGGTGRRSTCMLPSALRRSTVLWPEYAFSFAG